MVKKIRNFLILAGICYGFYFLMSNHIIIYGKSFTLLPKSEITFKYTFVNVENNEFRGPDYFLRIEDLRYDGIGDVLVELEIITDEELRILERQIDAEYY